MVKFEVDGEVGVDGMVHVATPELSPGDRVTVTVERKRVFEGERVFGLLRGKIHILPGFEDPIKGFE